MLNTNPTKEVAEMLDVGTAQVVIKRTGNKDQLGLYVEGELLYVTEDLHTYSSCADALLYYMNSY